MVWTNHRSIKCIRSAKRLHLRQDLWAIWCVSLTWLIVRLQKYQTRCSLPLPDTILPLSYEVGAFICPTHSWCLLSLSSSAWYSECSPWLWHTAILLMWHWSGCLDWLSYGLFSWLSRRQLFPICLHLQSTTGFDSVSTTGDLPSVCFCLNFQ